MASAVLQATPGQRLSWGHGCAESLAVALAASGCGLGLAEESPSRLQPVVFQPF